MHSIAIDVVMMNLVCGLLTLDSCCDGYDISGGQKCTRLRIPRIGLSGRAGFAAASPKYAEWALPLLRVHCGTGPPIRKACDRPC